MLLLHAAPDTKHNSTGMNIDARAKDLHVVLHVHARNGTHTFILVPCAVLGVNALAMADHLPVYPYACMQVYSDAAGAWGPICRPASSSSFASAATTAVVCSQLGYARSGLLLTSTQLQAHTAAYTAAAAAGASAAGAAAVAELSAAPADASAPRFSIDASCQVYCLHVCMQPTA